MTYFKKDDVMVCDSIRKDIARVADNMRGSDVAEIWASSNYKPGEALWKGYEESFKCLTILKDDQAIGMFGIHPNNFIGKTATIWLLATKELDDISRKFLKASRWFINMFLEFYPVLYNWTDSRNEPALKWLRFCGAVINEAVPYGVDQKPFHYFELRR